MSKRLKPGKKGGIVSSNDTPAMKPGKKSAIVSSDDASAMKPGKKGGIVSSNDAPAMKPGKKSGIVSSNDAPAMKPTTLGDRCGAFINRVVIPLGLMLTTPNAVMMIWFLCAKCNGSYAKIGNYLVHNNSDVITGVLSIWSHSRILTPFSITVILGFASWAALTMSLIPGKRFNGPVTPTGNVPVYRDNGLYCYVTTMFALMALSRFYDVTVIYDRFDEILGTLCLFSVIFCLLLYIKGRVHPSSSDSGSSGHIIFDYYWGLELHPRVFGLDIKTWTNCRFGMTAWPVLVAIFAMKSYQLHGFVDSMFVSAVLQLTYITKFFWWEAGYMSTIDIMLDRAGYYICWGCLVFIPGLYTSVSQYLVTHPVELGAPLASAILLAGLGSLALNYAADWQKQLVRSSDGNCNIWGRKPSLIRASYTLKNGKTKSSLLLTSGFWGISRHFHYIPELSLSLAWSLPALSENIFPYTYFIYLCVLLVHRSYRDDKKCSEKYGKYWTEYKNKVPYKIVPGLF